jgi:hypothetical protein
VEEEAEAEAAQRERDGKRAGRGGRLCFNAAHRLVLATWSAWLVQQVGLLGSSPNSIQPGPGLKRNRRNPDYPDYATARFSPTTASHTAGTRRLRFPAGAGVM